MHELGRREGCAHRVRNRSDEGSIGCPVCGAGGIAMVEPPHEQDHVHTDSVGGTT